MVGVDARLGEVALPARRQEPSVRRRVSLHVLVEPRCGVPVDHVGTPQRGPEGRVGDEAEVQVAPAPDDELARVGTCLGVGERLRRLGRRIGLGRVGQRRQTVVGRHPQRRLGDRGHPARRRVGGAGLLDGAAAATEAGVGIGSAEVVPRHDRLHSRVPLADVGDAGRPVGVSGEPQPGGVEDGRERVVGVVEALGDAPVLLGFVTGAGRAARHRRVGL